jgi:multidrug efflux pump subunit AcrA (membrane-fusion protein)
MNDIDETKKTTSPLKAVVLTALVTLALAGGIGYWLGMASGHLPSSNPVPADMEGADPSEAQLWTCGMHPWIIVEEPGSCPICEMELTPLRDAPDAGGAAASGERKVIYWRAPMDPTEIYDASGQSKMGMDLVPVYEDEVIGGVEISIDPVTQQNMGVRTAEVERGPLVHTIKTYGHVTYDETLSTQVSPRFSGWIEKMHVDFTGQGVKKGEVLFEIYSPELITAQEEYLIAFESLQGVEGDIASDLLGSAKKRLGYFGVAQREISALEKRGEIERTLKIRSPVSGVVIDKKVEEGSFVKRGTPVYRLADLSRLWVEVHIYEYELPWVEVGQMAVMSLPYIPGREFKGKVSFINPYLDQKTRDVVVRLVFDNKDMELKPEMYADVLISHGTSGEGLMIPSEAVIRSGARNVVFVSRGSGKFSPRELKLGPALDGGMVQALEGVAEGEQVVVSGQFLLDSESKLKEAVLKMLEAKVGGGKKEGAEKAGGADGDDFFDDVEEEPSGNTKKEKDAFFKDVE